MSKKSTTGEFISKSKLIHGDKYDYSKVEYVNNHSKVCIICPEHGEFWQTPANHLKNRGCPICGGHQKSSTEEFIKRTEIFLIKLDKKVSEIYKQDSGDDSKKLLLDALIEKLK